MIIIFREEIGIYSLIEINDVKEQLKRTEIALKKNDSYLEAVERNVKKLKRYCDECNLTGNGVKLQALVIDIKYRNLWDSYITEIDTDTLFDLFDKSIGDAWGNINVINKYIWNSACQYGILRKSANG